jgi:zinc resistance-associated protein
MKKTIVAAVAALAVIGTASVWAQQLPAPGPTPAAQPGPGPAAGHPEMTPEDQRAFLDARIAALKAGLELSPDQEKSWPAFEQAIRAFAKLRADRREAMRTATPPANPVERLRRAADALTGFGAALKQLADTAQPLYQSLDAGQKRRFEILARHLRPHDKHLHGMGEHGDHGPGGMGEGRWHHHGMGEGHARRPDGPQDGEPRR